MKEFIMSALPWIMTCLCIVVLAVSISRRSRRKDGEKKDRTENYGAEVMCLGMCLGVALETSFGSNTGIGLSLGMLIGLVIGSCIKRTDCDKDDNGKKNKA